VPRSFLAFILAFAAPLALGQSASPAGAADNAAGPVLAGKVALAEGDVRVSDARGQMRILKPGDPIYKGERIVTGADGEVHLDMADGGYIGVRPNTSMSIEDFKAEGGRDDRAILNLLRGSFRSITGWIARVNRQNYAVRTATATIGVRGTEHEPLVIPEGSTEGEPGTYDRVHNGETEMRTPQGTVGVKPNQVGFVPRRGTVRPRVLDSVPGFFRPTRNEGRFQGLHDRLHQQLQQRLQARRQLVEQRRKEQLERHGEKKSAIQPRQEQRRLKQEERSKLQGQRREQQQKLQEERRQQAGKAKIERERKRRETDKKQRERGAAKADRRE
jgi:FecR protein